MYKAVLCAVVADKLSQPADMAKFLTVVNDLLSQDECQKFIKRFESETLQHVQSDFADYHRSLFLDQELAARIYKEILPLIPATYQTTCANDHFRYSKYEPGGEFKIHRDGFNQNKYGHRSIITVNIFLNDDFSGGCTDFYHDYEYDSPRLSVQPKVGRAAVFESQQYHCGCPVTAGYKHLLRTDIMAKV